jgi:DNA-directed RNA polymerase subunit H (RpoH/RPB5)
MDPKLISNIFLAKKTQVQMLKDRGYQIAADELELLENEEYSERDFVKKFKITNQASVLSLNHKYIGPYNNCLVYYIVSDMDIGIETITGFMETLQTSGVSEAILITNQILTQKPQETIQSLTRLGRSFNEKLSLEELKALEKLNKLPYNIQHFMIQHLLYNPTHHFQVPEHYILTPKEREQFIKEKSGKTEFLPIKLPHIKLDDAICKYYGAKPKQIIRIKRKNITGSCLVREYYSYSYVS